MRWHISNQNAEKLYVLFKWCVILYIRIYCDMFKFTTIERDINGFCDYIVKSLLWRLIFYIENLKFIKK